MPKAEQPPKLTLADLADLPIWICWRAITRNGQTTEVPINPRTGKAASLTDPATWGTRAEAEAAVAADRSLTMRGRQ